MKRSLQFAAVLALAVISVPLSAGAREGVRQRCFPPGSRTVLKDREARVYRLVYHGDHEIWGCSYRTGRRSFLGLRDFSDFEGEYTFPIALRGRFVAVNVKTAGHDTGTDATVSVRDLRSAKRLHVWFQGGRACANRTEVKEVRVTATGAAAWIAEAQFGCGPSTMQVLRVDPSSRHARQLDSGVDIDRHYLVVKHGRMYWKHAGTTRNARIR